MVKRVVNANFKKSGLPLKIAVHRRGCKSFDSGVSDQKCTAADSKRSNLANFSNLHLLL